jgi:diketogulonate reductase-like aldo/keto reductase
VSSKPGEYVFPVKEKDLLPMDFQSVWEAMEECQKLGLAKSIGVSNFSCKKLENLLATAKIPPAVNQVSYILISSSHSLLFFFFFFFSAAI